MIIVIIGESCSGKTTLANYFAERHYFEKVVTYTTRPIRAGEVDGVDYHFINDENFDKLQSDNFFLETSLYNNWHYGTPLSHNRSDKIIVLSPSGMRKLKKITDKDELITVYLRVPRRCRMIKSLQRGDNIEEVYRRSLSDVGMFDGIENEVDHVIDNDNYEKSVNDLTRILYSYYLDAYFQNERRFANY